jgi:uncharacterized protein (DUF1778 family)
VIEVKKKRGRPKLSTEERKRAIFSIRLSPEERAEIEAAAEAKGLKASDWARSILLEAAQGSQD